MGSFCVGDRVGLRASATVSEGLVTDTAPDGELVRAEWKTRFHMDDETTREPARDLQRLPTLTP
ncbi:MAG: hypothetical protein DMD79_20985 [Candidatus Rokuibacteriota bacterium]|nr:MAG: hypothetical protein DMD79_20985 [Candidatus Rokubacteria bacterium]